MTDSDEKKRIAYNILAPAYDVASDALTLGIHRLVRRQFCKLVAHALPRGAKVIDVGTGTGSTIFALADQRADATLIGIDIAEVMIRKARMRLETPAHHVLAARTSFLVGDAAALPFPNASADVVMFAWSLAGIGNRAAALREALRVLRPHGQIFILETSLADTRDSALKAVERHLPKRLRVPLASPVRRLDDETLVLSSLRPLLKDAGFEQIEPHKILAGTALAFSARRPHRKESR